MITSRKDFGEKIFKMKKRNYYTIHKNKKKRKDVYNKKLWRLIGQCQLFVKNAILVSKSLKELSKSIKEIPIPNYKSGGKMFPIIGIDLANGNDMHAESIILPNGVIQVLKPDENLFKVMERFNINVFDVNDYVVNIPNNVIEQRRIELLNRPIPDFSEGIKGIIELNENLKNCFPNKKPESN